MWLIVLFTVPLVGWFLAVKSYWFRRLVQKPWAKLWGTKRAKPFDCPGCMSFWISTAILAPTIKTYYDVIIVILVTFACRILGYIMEVEGKRNYW